MDIQSQEYTVVHAIKIFFEQQGQKQAGLAEITDWVHDLKKKRNLKPVLDKSIRSELSRLVTRGILIRPKDGIYEPANVQNVKSRGLTENIIIEGCFLSEKKLGEILERLRSKKNIILQGPPGTGKTWLAKRLAYALIESKDKKKVLSKQFHSNLSYEDFIIGWRPSQNGNLILSEGPMLKMVNEAKKHPNSKYVLVIEEINRGNPTHIFGEMLTLIEADKRSKEEAIELTYNKNKEVKVEERVHIPENLYIIGTMNLADRAIAHIDLALRRRFIFVEMEPIFGESWQNWVHKSCGIELLFLKKIKDLVDDKLNQIIEEDSGLGKQFKIGHSYFTPSTNEIIDDQMEWYLRIVEYQIKPLLEDYWFDSPETSKNEVKKLNEGIEKWNQNT